jgi:hypothetical protein
MIKGLIARAGDLNMRFELLSRKDMSARRYVLSGSDDKIMYFMKFQ